MSDLYDRLRRITGETGDQAEGPSRGRGGQPIEDLVDGQWIESDEGRCFVTEARYAPGYTHGQRELRHALDLGPALLELAPLPAGVDMGDLLFLDAETTGLGRDAGTVAFLVGVGWFQDDWFVARQLFMSDYDDELALLTELTRLLGQRNVLATFNGVTFDWPLLANRYLYNGLPAPQLGGHLDLLHWSRSLWRNVLPSCALSSLENQVLGVQRAQEDVPGYLIPQLYYDYLRSGDASPLAGVFYHNLIDVISMACLAGRIAETIVTPHQELQDMVAIGRLHERLGRYDEALAAYDLAVASGEPALVMSAAEREGLLLKRLGRIDEAAQLWVEHLAEASIVPTVELAKHLEHRLRDYAAAREVVAQGIARVRAGEIEHPWPRDLLNELEHRLARLERRLATADDQADQEST